MQLVHAQGKVGPSDTGHQHDSLTMEQSQPEVPPQFSHRSLHSPAGCPGRWSSGGGNDQNFRFHTKAV